MSDFTKEPFTNTSTSRIYKEHALITLHKIGYTVTVLLRVKLLNYCNKFGIYIESLVLRQDKLLSKIFNNY